MVTSCDRVIILDFIGDGVFFDVVGGGVGLVGGMSVCIL